MNPTFLKALEDSPVSPALAARLSTATASEKNAFISACIKTLCDAGMALPAAFDAVIGDGAYQRLSDEVWTRLQPT